jgi:hypothetical protein
MQYVHNTAYTEQLSDSELIAYHRGYQAGFDYGALDTEYNHNSQLQAAYCTGYDAGVLAFWAEIDEGATPD